MWVRQNVTLTSLHISKHRINAFGSKKTFLTTRSGFKATLRYFFISQSKTRGDERAGKVLSVIIKARNIDTWTIYDWA